MCQGLASPAAAFNIAFVLQRRLSVLVWLLDSAAAATTAAAAAPAVTRRSVWQSAQTPSQQNPSDEDCSKSPRD